MSLFKSFDRRRTTSRRAKYASIPYNNHFTRPERTMRTDTLSCAMSAPEPERRYAVYMSTWR